MTGKTHRAGGMLVSIVGFSILRQRGLLLPNVNEGLQWLVMYPFTMWGSVASDLDHHWESCPMKDYPSKLVNMTLHATTPLKKSLDKTMNEAQKKYSIVYKIANLFSASHRSWQTHSDLTLFVMLWLLYNVLNKQISGFSAIDSAIAALVLTGISLGIIAHFILDAITPEGIWLVGLASLDTILNSHKHGVHLPRKLHLVPHSEFFKTGGQWEMFIQRVLKVSTIIALLWFLYTLCSPFLGNIIPFKFSFY